MTSLDNQEILKFTVYKTTNLLDGKFYVGKHQTYDPNDDYLGSGKLLGYAIEKHGEENFKKEVLFIFETEAEMNAKEAEIVTPEFCKRPDVYNLCPGGQGGWGYINENKLNQTEAWEEARKRNWKSANKESIRLFKEDLKFRDKVISKISISMKATIKENGYWWTDRKHSEETKLKMSMSKQINPLVGNKNGSFGTMWITNGSENKKIKRNELIPEGWDKGRIIKSSKNSVL